MVPLSLSLSLSRSLSVHESYYGARINTIITAMFLFLTVNGLSWDPSGERLLSYVEDMGTALVHQVAATMNQQQQHQLKGTKAKDKKGAVRTPPTVPPLPNASASSKRKAKHKKRIQTREDNKQALQTVIRARDPVRSKGKTKVGQGENQGRTREQPR